MGKLPCRNVRKLSLFIIRHKRTCFSYSSFKERLSLKPSSVVLAVCIIYFAFLMLALRSELSWMLIVSIKSTSSLTEKEIQLKGRKHGTRGGSAQVSLPFLRKPGVSGCPWNGLASSGQGAKLWLFHTQLYSKHHPRDRAWKARDWESCCHYFFSISNSSPRDTCNQNPFPSSITFIMFSIFL